MTASTQTNFLIRGGRVYDHDGDVHQPAVADLLINGETIERVAPDIAAGPAPRSSTRAASWSCPASSTRITIRTTRWKGMFEEMPFDIWTLHTNAGSYGPRSHQEVRLRTLIGAAENASQRHHHGAGFPDARAAGPGHLDTVLSAYGRPASASCSPSPRATAPRSTSRRSFRRTAGIDPQAHRRHDRTASEELDFVAAQIKRLGKHPPPLKTWALAPSAPQRCSPELLEGIAALSRQHGLPVFTHVYETRIQAAAARQQASRRCSTCWSAPA